MDADNRLCGVPTGVRLDAEALRDSLLYVAGNLDLTVGGPRSGSPTAIIAGRSTVS